MSDKAIQTITAKLDCTMIEKARLFTGKKENKKGVLPQYLDIVLMPLEDDYGNHYMVVQSVSKAEREAGVKGPIPWQRQDHRRRKSSAISSRAR